MKKHSEGFLNSTMNNKQQPPAGIESISRVLRSHQEARQAYNRLSRVYDLIAGAERKFTRIALKLLAVQPGERGLDLGCGTGSALADLASETGQKAIIVGCDLSPGMLSRAGAQTRRLDSFSAISLVGADAALLPMRSASFDAILLSFTLELFDTPEIPKVLAECQRVLKPGGRLALVSLAKTASAGWMERGYEWVHAHYEQLADCRPITAPEFICKGDFSIQSHHRESMWGLPVDILLAIKPASEE